MCATRSIHLHFDLLVGLSAILVIRLIAFCALFLPPTTIHPSPHPVAMSLSNAVDPGGPIRFVVALAASYDIYTTGGYRRVKGYEIPVGIYTTRKGYRWYSLYRLHTLRFTDVGIPARAYYLIVAN